ncbi:MAG TPA: SAM-dependent methyltransferase [Verrucomicrobiae bacterium]|nr:SAM-dependent methyltransferase [Verrucomicrobiae bacterium]
MSEIEHLVRQEVSAMGPISFARFMQLALYCPKIGYYERDSRVIGFAGDFYTSPSIGPLFGHLVAAQFAFWSVGSAWQPLSWLEAGAHDGTLALAILEWLGKKQPELLDRLNYCIIESSLVRRQWQEEKLRDYAKYVSWRDSVEALRARSLRGIAFCNEFLDAFPVNRVVWDRSRSKWYEMGIGMEGERFVWRRLEEATIDIDAQMERSGLALTRELLEVLPDGFVMDLSPEAGDWWMKAAQALDSGKLVAIDYGLTADEILAPERTNGTLRAYYQQRISDDPLARVGEQDLTAHVNFTQLQRIGEAAGLRTETFSTQERFLFDLIQRKLGGIASERWSAAEIRQFQSLTHPEQLGRRFRVLVQSR